MSYPAFFVSTDWLAAHLLDDDLVVVDGTFFMPAETRDARGEYLAGHIPGAVFFDIEAIADRTNPLPHMLPDAAAFAAAMERLGIADTMRVVVYGAASLQGVARVWWTLRLYGMREVKILEGGLPAWKQEGRPLESGAVTRPPRRFTPRFDAAAVADLARMRSLSESSAAQIVDARAAGRFRGEVPEPRPGLPSGHIPGSLNVPWQDLVSGHGLKEPEALKQVFDAAGVALDRPVVTTCGSGVTAAIVLLALEALGKREVGLYDGSWTEWGGHPELPVATG